MGRLRRGGFGVNRKGSPKAGRVARIMQYFTPDERIRTHAIVGKMWQGWSVLVSPTTGEPDIIRLLRRDDRGALRQVVTIRERPRRAAFDVRSPLIGSIENHPDFE